MTEEKKKVITREKHPGYVAQGHKLAALIKKRKEEIFRHKEQSTEQSNGAYIYGIGMLWVLAIGVCVFFAYNTFQHTRQVNEKENQLSKRRHML